MTRWPAVAVLIFVSVRALAQKSPYDVLHRAYAPYLSADEPLALSLKMQSLATSEYKFWRGSKDLFFLWCKSSAADWLADREAYVESHADLHFGNIGTYPSERGINKLAFGMVDFDDSALLPFQIELLQGLVTFELTARQNQIDLTDARRRQLLEEMLGTYRLALNSQRTATALLVDANDPLVTAMLARNEQSYEAELDRFTVDGRFRDLVRNEKGKVTDVLEPAMDRASEIAAGLAEAIDNEPDLRRIFRYRDAEAFHGAIVDIAQRWRLGSSGSQGLRKYLVLLRSPLQASRGDFIVYLKQEIPSAAERSGAIPTEPSSPGQRVKRSMDRLCDPAPYINSWFDLGGESCWVSLKEPWSDELDGDSVGSFDDLRHRARIWATVAGAAHRRDAKYAKILSRLTPDLNAALLERARAWLAVLDEQFESFRSNPRVAGHARDVKGALAGSGGPKS